MTEHIRKQAVLNLIDEFQYNHESNTWGVTKDGVVVLKPDTLDKLREAVKAMPAANVAPVVHAYWLGIEGDGYDPEGNIVWDTFECTNCGKEHYADGEPEWEYCPECGAKMDGEQP